MSTPPKASMAASTKPVAPSAVLTSATRGTTRTSGPSGLLSVDAASSTLARVRPHSATCTPSATSARATPRPRPEEEAATAARRPAIPRSMGGTVPPGPRSDGPHPTGVDLASHGTRTFFPPSRVRPWRSGSGVAVGTRNEDNVQTSVTRAARLARRSAAAAPRGRTKGGDNTERDARVDERFRTFRTTGDRDLRNQLIEEHRWLAVHCAQRFAHKGEPLDDLVQVAMLGVLKAVERFDPEYGVVFSTFAVPTITGELRRHFRDTTWAVHVPRRSRDLQHTVKVAVGELGHAFGRSPTAGEVAEHAGVAVEDVLDALEAARCYRKAPLPAAGDDDDGDIDNIGDHDRGIDAVDARVTIDALLRVLPARDRRIVELRYMSGLTQSQIATLVGVSQVQVSRLLRASLAKLNRALEDAPGAAVAPT